MSAKSEASRRLKWAARQWHKSKRGNLYLNTRRFSIVVFGSPRGHRIKIEQRNGGGCQSGRRRYETRGEVQAAAFEALLWAKHTWRGNGRYELRGTTMETA